MPSPQVMEPFGQGLAQIVSLCAAFALSSLVGAERQWRGKSAGLRTQAIVGTASALVMLVSKYGFSDVAVKGLVTLDPSRVAAQIVSGIGFLGAGIIITGAVPSGASPAPRSCGRPQRSAWPPAQGCSSWPPS